MARKLPTGTISRVHEINGRTVKQYRASLSDPSQRSANGRIKRVSSKWFNSLSDAKSWLDDKRNELHNKGSLMVNKKIKMSDAVIDWIDIAGKVGINGRQPIEHSTSERYLSSNRKVIQPSIGNLRISDITAPQMVLWRDNMVLNHGNDAARRALTLVKQVLAYHVTIGSIITSPAANLRLAKASKNNSDYIDVFMSPDDVGKILTCLDRLAIEGDLKSKISASPVPDYITKKRISTWLRVRVIVYMLILSGLRMGEASALRWGDISWQDSTIRVERALKRGGAVGCTKNKSSIRTIKMGNKFMSMLHEFYKTAKRPGENFYVFGLDGLSPLNANGFGRRQWTDLMKEAGFFDGNKNIWTPHDCRHYHASKLIMSGVNIQLVADRLGHANTTVTQTVYAHLFNELAGKANTAGADLEDSLIGL